VHGQLSSELTFSEISSGANVPIIGNGDVFDVASACGMMRAAAGGNGFSHNFFFFVLSKYKVSCTVCVAGACGMMCAAAVMR